MSLAAVARIALAVARLHTAQDRGLVGPAVEGAAPVGPVVLVRERPKDAGAGAGGGTSRQYGCAGTNHASGNGKGGRCGLPVQHAGHLEQGYREGAERDQPGPEPHLVADQSAVVECLLFLVAMSVPP